MTANSSTSSRSGGIYIGGDRGPIVYYQITQRGYTKPVEVFELVYPKADQNYEVTNCNVNILLH